ncbi:MAG: histone deacetylase family protein [Pyrodictiaceae archaeon]
MCIYYDELFRMHKPWFYHPETPERLDRIVAGLRESGLWDRARILGVPSGRVRRELAERVHSKEYVDEIEAASRRGRLMLDGDTYVNEHTFAAALGVLASVEDAVERLLSGECDLALILGRPPGHHAGRYGAAMGAPTLGFCIFNASALASLLLAERLGSLLHIDFDLHHGNGTQDILYRDPRVFHVDLHQDPATIYPGTGWPWQVGEGEAEGTKANIVLPPGAGDDIFCEAVSTIPGILEAKGFKPRMMVFSAGFDAYMNDGLGALRLTEKSFHCLASRMREEYGGRALVVWEGGYSLGLEKGAPAFVKGLLGEEPGRIREETSSSRALWDAFSENMHKLYQALGIAKG